MYMYNSTSVALREGNLSEVKEKGESTRKMTEEKRQYGEKKKRK